MTDIKHIIFAIVAIVAAIGAINWLLTVYKFNLVEKLFGVDTTLTKGTYVLVGICGIVTLVVQGMRLANKNVD